jgi:hypothetical protein
VAAFERQKIVLNHFEQFVSKQNLAIADRNFAPCFRKSLLGDPIDRTAHKCYFVPEENGNSDTAMQKSREALQSVDLDKGHRDNARYRFSKRA